MKKVILVIVGLIILGGSYAFYQFNKKTPSLDNTKPDYTLTAEELYTSFSTNEQDALERYEGKVLQIEGDILTITQTDSISNIILNSEDALFGAVNCSFKSLKSQHNKNDKITLKGRCQGFLNSVVLNNCVVVK